ncbi:MAG TPA: hypothetical protein VHO24_20710 [Opitutaceae bacterium]|nr:hypothetical protein [Opitutaceae bacterium]
MKLLRFLSFLLVAIGPARAAESPRVLHDLAHGQTPLARPLKEVATKLGITVADSKAPITAQLLEGVRLLYLRAPSGEFTAAERESIVGFVEGGGSLLLVLDEENRQSLAVTRVNDLIAPFGLKLSPDLPYLHNCGGVAKAGAINAADREIPYSGGRAVEGGVPFAFVLDQDGKPAAPFAASVTRENGARIVVVGEGMASLFLGKPEGVRLTGVSRDFSQTTYWGKDSAVFMEELIAWLVKK